MSGCSILPLIHVRKAYLDATKRLITLAGMAGDIFLSMINLVVISSWDDAPTSLSNRIASIIETEDVHLVNIVAKQCHACAHSRR